MSFMFYDIIFLITFSIFVIVFLIKHKKNLKREGILFLYKTTKGIKFIDYIGTKYRNILHKLKYVVIFVGYFLMAYMLYLLGQLVYIFFKFPDFIRAVKIPPLMPLIPYIPSIFKIDFLPPLYFTYWISILAITAIVHEFSHGIFAKLNDIKIKTTGFAFLGPFVGAFVEPDEEKMKKLRIRDQITILSAGTFANIIVAIVSFIIMWLFFVSAFTPSGVIFNTYAFSVINTSDIDYITNNTISITFDGGLNLTEIQTNSKTFFIKNEDMKNINSFEQVIAFEDVPALRAGLKGVIIEFNGVEIKENDNLLGELSKYSPGDEVEIKTLFNEAVEEYNLVLAESPYSKGRAYLGISLIQGSGMFSKIRNLIVFFKDQNTHYTAKANPDLVMFIYNLIWWLILINFSVGLVNMLPVGIFDGGRVFYLTMFALTKSEERAKRAFSFVTKAILFLFFLLMVLWVFSFR